MAALLALAGLGFCCWAAYQGLAAVMGPVNAGFVTGGAMLLLAGSMAWIAIRFAR